MGSDALASSSGGNAISFIPGVRCIPFEWSALGPVVNSRSITTPPSLSGRITFQSRSGFDALEQVPSGRIVDGSADLGIAIKSQGLALALTTSNLTWCSGADDPLQAVGGATVPSLKATIAARVGEEVHLAGSWDIKLKRPELSLSWSGSTFTECASVLAVVDPVSSTLRVSAAVVTPGPEWRKDLYDADNDRVEEPEDSGARHALYVDHTARRRDLLHRTTLGARLDVGRLMNLVAYQFEGRVFPKIPTVLWRVPLMKRIYRFIIPPFGVDQMRYYVSGWELDVSTRLGSAAAAGAGGDDQALALGALGALGRPAVALRKHALGATLAAHYGVVEREGTLSISSRGLTLGMVVQRPEAGRPWGRPSLLLQVEPLSLL